MPNAPIPFDNVLADKKPAALTLELINDTAHADIVGRAKERHDLADQRRVQNPSPAATDEYLDAFQALEEARAAAREHTRYWRFVSVGRPEYEKLLDAHQATKAQRDDNRKKQLARGVLPANVTQVAWSVATFPPALISACCIGVFVTENDAEAAVVPDEPYLDAEQAQALWDSKKFNDAELDAIFSAALLVNRLNRTADLGNG
jgi:hypothetical protein